MNRAELSLWLAFNIGAAGQWLWQWQKWKTPERKWKGFWSDLGLKHILSNLMLDQVCFCIWSLGLLDGAIDKVGHSILPPERLVLIHGGDSRTLQMALAMGYFFDMLGDQIIYTLRSRLRGVKGFFSKSAPPPPEDPA